MKPDHLRPKCRHLEFQMLQICKQAYRQQTRRLCKRLTSTLPFAFYFTKIHGISCHFSIPGSSLTCATGLFPFLAEGCGFQSSEARWILPLTWSICARLLGQLLKAKLPLQRCITGCHSDGQWGVIFLDHEEVPRGKFRPHEDSDSDSQDLPEKLLGFHVFTHLTHFSKNIKLWKSNGSKTKCNSAAKLNINKYNPTTSQTSTNTRS